MDYAIDRNDNSNNDDDDDEEECVVVKTVLCDNKSNRNSPTTSTTFEISRIDADLGSNFIPALIENKHVQYIRNLPVSLALYFAPVGGGDMNSRSCCTQLVVDRYTGPLLQFLQTSESLRRIHLNGMIHAAQLNREEEDNNGELFLQQIAEAVTHNQHIEDVEIDKEYCVAPQTIARFVAASHIKSFSVRIGDFYGSAAAAAADNSIDLLLHALRTNQTLETLSLYHRFMIGSESDSVVAVLNALSGQRHSRIRVLTMTAIGGVDHGPIVAALANFVGETTSLEHLQLIMYSFVLEDVTLLLDNLSVAKLTMTNCKLDDPSRMKLASFVQASSSLKELALCSNIFPDSLIGSSLQVLDLSGARSVNVGALFLALGASTNDIHLPCLHLGKISLYDWKELLLHLPSQIYLRELHVGSVPTGAEARYFIRKIRQNGSLHRVFLTSDKESDHSLGESEIQVLKAVCTRNRVLSQALLLLLDTQQYDERWNDSSSSGPSSSNEKEKSHRRPTSLIPSLLHAACTIPRTGPNVIFTSLLSWKVSAVGLGNGTKRLRL